MTSVEINLNGFNPNLSEKMLELIVEKNTAENVKPLNLTLDKIFIFRNPNATTTN